MQVKDLINIRGRRMNGIFKRGECNDIIEFCCTEITFLFLLLFICVILIWNKCCLIMAKKELQT